MMIMIGQNAKWRRRLWLGVMPLLLALLLCLVSPATAHAASIRVCLKTGATSSEFLVTAGTYNINGGALTASTLATAKAGDTIRTVLSGSSFTIYLNGSQVGTSKISIAILATGEGSNVIKYSGTEYRGSMSVLTNGYILNVLDMEQYLYGVVGQEMGYGSPTEALRAQAIVARTYATYNLGGTYYDVSASSSSQLYGGYTAEKATGGSIIVAAVDDTAHQVLYYNGSVIEAVFSSSAGGYTASNEIVWGGVAVPYLRSVPSPYDADYNFASWEVTYTAAELKSLAESYMKRIGQSGSFGSFVRLDISYADGSGKATVSGRATKATLIGSSGSVTAQNDAVRTMLGLKSNLFKVYDSAASAAADTATTTTTTTSSDKVYVLNAAGDLEERSWKELVAVNSSGVTKVLGDLTAASMRSSAGLTSLGKTASTSSSSSSGQISVSLQGSSVVIRGSGYGHGVGMSQYGAIGMAKAGSTAEEILRHYYGGENSSLLVIRNIG